MGVDLRVVRRGRRRPRGVDINLYHVGNNPEAHGWIVEALRKQPGLVVLHDFVLEGGKHRRQLGHRLLGARSIDDEEIGSLPNLQPVVLHHLRLTTPVPVGGDGHRRPHPLVELAPELGHEALFVVAHPRIALGQEDLAMARFHSEELQSCSRQNVESIPPRRGGLTIMSNRDWCSDGITSVDAVRRLLAAH